MANPCSAVHDLRTYHNTHASCVSVRHTAQHQQHMHICTSPALNTHLPFMYTHLLPSTHTYPFMYIYCMILDLHAPDRSAAAGALGSQSGGSTVGPAWQQCTPLHCHTHTSTPHTHLLPLYSSPLQTAPHTTAQSHPHLHPTHPPAASIKQSFTDSTSHHHMHSCHTYVYTVFY